MSYNWGPHYIVPSQILKTYSGIAQLRETFDEALLQKELEALNISLPIVKITNPWYYRKKGESTWLKIGESDDSRENFPITWDTKTVANGQYEIMGLMHVIVKDKNKDKEKVIARQNIVEVTVQN